MNLFLKYFWIIGVGIGLINGYSFQRKIKTAILTDKSNESEIKNLVVGYYSALTIPFLLLQVLQILGKYNTSFYIFLLDFSNIYYTLAFTVLISCWILLVYWVVLKNGAGLISKYNSSFGNFPKDTKLIKLITILCVFGGIIAFIISNNMPGFTDFTK